MLAEDKVQRGVVAVSSLSREELAAVWVKAYGCQPPKAAKRALLERAAAWHIQARRLGGLSTLARRAIRESLSTASTRSADDRSASQMSRSAGQQAASIPPRSGTRLMREWHGRMHIVDVTDKGFIFDGKNYRSLSAIARRITGAQWSGPRFFGL